MKILPTKYVKELYELLRGSIQCYQQASCCVCFKKKKHSFEINVSAKPRAMSAYHSPYRRETW